MFKIIKPNGDIYKGEYESEQEAREWGEAIWGSAFYSLNYNIKESN
jgi:hypothetical protein